MSQISNYGKKIFNTRKKKLRLISFKLDPTENLPSPSIEAVNEMFSKLFFFQIKNQIIS